MASRVIFRAPPPVKIMHATFKVGDVWSVNPRYMAVTVICHAPLTVMTTRVTIRMEHALHVNLDGLEYTVKQVILLIIYVIKI